MVVDTKPKKVKEPTSFSMSNPSRLIPSQARFVSLQEGQRYVPVCRQNRPAGIVMLRDTDPSAPEVVEKGTFCDKMLFVVHLLPCFLLHSDWFL